MTAGRVCVSVSLFVQLCLCVLVWERLTQQKQKNKVFDCIKLWFHLKYLNAYIAFYHKLFHSSISNPSSWFVQSKAVEGLLSVVWKDTMSLRYEMPVSIHDPQIIFVSVAGFGYVLLTVEQLLSASAPNWNGQSRLSNRNHLVVGHVSASDESALFSLPGSIYMKMWQIQRHCCLSIIRSVLKK